jgi:hypothetical protein
MSANEDRSVMAGRVCVSVWYNPARNVAYIFFLMLRLHPPPAPHDPGPYSTSSLENEFKTLSAENERLEERIRNLASRVRT